MKLDNDRKADFRTENPRSAFSFLAVKIAVFRADCARRPLSGAGLAEKKIILASLRYFLSPSLAAIPGKQTGKTSKIKMPTHVGRCFNLKRTDMETLDYNRLLLVSCGNTTTTGMKG